MESKFTKVICDALKKRNALVFAIVAGKRQEPGWPDRYVAHTLWSGWLEFKGPKTVVTDLQRYRLRELVARGVEAWVLREPDIIENHSGIRVTEFEVMDLLEVLNDLSMRP